MSVGSDNAKNGFSEHAATPNNKCNKILQRRSIQIFTEKPEEIQVPSALDQLGLSSAAIQAMKIHKSRLQSQGDTWSYGLPYEDAQACSCNE